VAEALSHLIKFTLLDSLSGVDQLNELSDDDVVGLITLAMSMYLTASGAKPERRPTTA